MSSATIKHASIIDSLLAEEESVVIGNGVYASNFGLFSLVSAAVATRFGGHCLCGLKSFPPMTGYYPLTRVRPMTSIGLL